MDILSVFRLALADRRHGATDVERRLIRSLLECRINWNCEVLLQGASLIEADSLMANLMHLAANIKEFPEPYEIECCLVERLGVLDRLDELLVEAGLELVMPYSVVVTLSRSSAVEAVLVGAHNRRWKGRVIVFDGTPSGCGPAQADRYREAGLEVRSLPDGAMNEVVSVDPGRSVVLVGADAVGPRRVVNAQGTGLLLETASLRGIVTVVVADTGKDVGELEIDRCITKSRIHRELGPGRTWPVFEAISKDLIRERLTEEGRVEP
jgi:translation initiation factor 2B subunit (eIF-2B alpha/beta/delta family)